MKKHLVNTINTDCKWTVNIKNLMSIGSDTVKLHDIFEWPCANEFWLIDILK